ncbi:ATP-binding cassette domain-containing protein [Flavobacteriaceae bacterium]|nr:ATP-binding cassette domain-containing protein [Flavobacteriaceae bacterium]MDB0069574.1 ATP-binding cassette domain-containing protein [Flavobacteriaceae bacterium]MDB4093596.1 ATP-binding cassette domain-containing protein [Flavobacteriaceae bacterium]MDB9849361.1 ATP-binding cassette domain-containing protein [Flavobacteriaceae bacterium]MDB9853465.1 ATP-binding cassette domain-containing protein [Flavobacteriaceae bacterium]|tara:strand:- start:1159 stop:1782 length:624 start_codon:yes stop_codon:yes gene_type:complete
MLITKEVEFNYDNQIFFKFQNIDLKSNENLLIIGNSGVGKTTLMHLLAGLLKSNSGSIKLFDQELSQLSSHQLDIFRKNNIGIVFQRSHFVNSLTVKENLQLAQYIANKKDNNRIESILKKLNIFDKSNKKTNQLSQGEKQRASIALAIVNSPKLILADEPTSSLDDTNCSKVIKLLKKQATDFGAQLIVITHDSRLKEHFKKSIEL